MSSETELVRQTVAQTISAVLDRLPKPERIAYPLTEAADLVGLNYRTLYDAYARGEFAAVRRCRKIIVTRAELLRWLSDAS